MSTNHQKSLDRRIHLPRVNFTRLLSMIYSASWCSHITNIQQPITESHHCEAIASKSTCREWYETDNQLWTFLLEIKDEVLWLWPNRCHWDGHGPQLDLSSCHMTIDTHRILWKQLFISPHWVFLPPSFFSERPISTQVLGQSPTSKF